MKSSSTEVILANFPNRLSNDRYLVKVLENHAIIAASEIYESLDAQNESESDEAEFDEEVEVDSEED
ncbi:hypothetical protein [Cohnella panacarvi]|uniref:hypothetical protein n=1 Tax=Cohnella panacarvi TaxID=400776 RepID=UPI000479C1D8|nr:hypothetical protein [Cohnella panacarvi]